MTVKKIVKGLKLLHHNGGNSSIFKPKAFNYYQPGIIPKYVITFRGTTIKKHSFSQDLWLDLNIIKHGLHQSTRYGVAMLAVQTMVSAVGASNVVDREFFGIFHRNAWQKREGLTVAMKGYKENRSPDDLFTALSSWVPRLFVNPADYICSECIGYFVHRDRMKYLGVWGIENLETQTSVTGLLKSAIGRESEVVHVVPLANLTINQSPSWELPTFMQVHGLQQWLRDDLLLQSKIYQYRL
ncbi:hypothetical protein MKX03_006715 [Papaver bracteatum]|nr:hypothetical protein MKX03_006715 [Papaver bracteatum]